MFGVVSGVGEGGQRGQLNPQVYNPRGAKVYFLHQKLHILLTTFKLKGLQS